MLSNCRYVARIRAQPPRSEEIHDVGKMCAELVKVYARTNNCKPQKIIYFRDGVSDGQFDMVLNKEVENILQNIQSEDYAPSITVIVAKKRHHTRLFPKTGSGQLRGNNVPPGTVVDSKIVDGDVDFYLCSHKGTLGTSKPAHYYSLRDDHQFIPNELQTLVYNLCFTYARCTKPVSLVPPVYYADLAAYRGRLYYDKGAFDMNGDNGTLTLHEDIKDEMFFL
jgi:eukaryotic translation initiation factor 2C